MRTTNRIGTTLTALLLISGVPALSAGPDDGARRTRPGYARERVERPESSRPADPDVPSELKLAAPVAGARSAESPAVSAAAWTAAALARTEGRLAYYRAGAYDGIRAALADDRLGAWDHADGVRRGQRDPEALAMGAAAGARAADEDAEADAAVRVEGQYRDLAREPRFDARPDARAYAAPGSWIDAPELHEVFEAYPLRRAPRRLLEAFDGWGYDPWRLTRCASRNEFLDRSWSDASRAFEYWASDGRRAAGYRVLRSDAERRAFRSAFVAAYPAALSRQYSGRLAGAYAEGWEDGWAYGAELSYEWHFRLGYREGFERAASLAAEVAYRAAYGRSYERAYERTFDAWARDARPGILGLRVFDANDDGVFEPGEEVELEADLANYGGGSSSFVLRAGGPDVERPAELEIALRGRGRVSSPGAVRVALRSDAAPRSIATLAVELGEARDAVEIPVDWPVEFDDGVATDVRALDGAARIEVSILNRSRRPVPAAVVLERVGGRAAGEVRDAGVLEPGGRRSFAFDVGGVAPLDLISGRVDVGLAVFRGEQRLEGLTYRFPDVVEDLGNRDLVDYLFDLAARSELSPREESEARAAMLRRLRADWAAAAAGRGNPYKDDLKDGGARTALGDLLETWRASRGRLRHPELFRRLGDDVEALVEDLPGAHPLLRKSMRKLARELG